MNEWKYRNELCNGKKKKVIKTTHQDGAVLGPETQQSGISITTEGSSLPTKKQV